MVAEVVLLVLLALCLMLFARLNLVSFSLLRSIPLISVLSIIAIVIIVIIISIIIIVDIIAVVVVTMPRPATSCSRAGAMVSRGFRPEAWQRFSMGFTGFRLWEFPKIRGTYFGDLIIRILLLDFVGCRRFQHFKVLGLAALQDFVGLCRAQ